MGNKVYRLRIGIVYEGKDSDGVLARCTSCNDIIHIDKNKHIIIDASPYCLRCALSKLRRMLPRK